MVRGLLALMDALGIQEFSVAGHDRGSYAAFRFALDHPQRLSKVALLDSLPIVEHLERIDSEFATPNTPERVINADPDSWYYGDAERMGHDNYEEWRAAIRNPDVVRGMLEDYRAGLTIDRADEEADRAAGRRIEIPLLVLWSLQADLEQLYGDPLVICPDWAVNVRGHGIDSGHHMAEEAPEALTDALANFFAEA